VDFLVSRSRQFNEEVSADYDPKNPPLVTPGPDEPPPTASSGPVRHEKVVNFR
jgi:hypothetical protein